MYLEMTECHILFPVTETLTSDLVLIIIVMGAISIYLIFFEVGIPNLVCMHLGMEERHLPFSGHCDLSF